MVHSDQDRILFEGQVRRLLHDHWPKPQASLTTLWRELGANSLVLLCVDSDAGNVRELLITMAELGRAACPAPLLDAVLAQLAIDGRAGAGELAQRLYRIQTGEARVGFSFGSFEGDPHAGGVRVDATGRLHGTAMLLGEAEAGDDLAVLVEGPALAWIRADATGLILRQLRSIAPNPVTQVVLHDVSAALLPVTPQQICDWNLLARLAFAARAYGATRRSFELVVDYAKVRRQFGQAIGAFQAIQHKLANGLLALEGVRVSIEGAAESHDFEQAAWRVQASAAYAWASTALRQTTLETHHVFGAIGYCEEHEAPRHFRRVHADLARFGGRARAQAELASYVSEVETTLPDLDLGPQGNAVRDQVRSWLAVHWTEEAKRAHLARPFADRARNPAFQKLLGQQGWVGLSWPVEYGGRSWSPLEQLAYMEELERAQAPVSGMSLQAPALIQFGTAQQQALYLPGILRGEIQFCLGYSEPGAGSDLASLITSARRDSDGWVIEGTKIWNSSALNAEYVWLAARTNPNATRKQDGISVFIVPIDAPGLQVWPSMAMHGRAFATLHFDRVRVPDEALVGEVDQGWRILSGALADERMLMGSSVNRSRRVLGGLVDYQKRERLGALDPDSASGQLVGQLTAEIEVARRLMLNCVRIAQQGRIPVHEAAMSKVYSGELMERVAEAALDLGGWRATLSEGEPEALLDGEVEQFLRHSPMYVIGGGTAEIQRNLIARHGLGMPRAVDK